MRIVCGYITFLRLIRADQKSLCVNNDYPYGDVYKKQQNLYIYTRCV